MSVKVAVRVRPFNSHEKEKGSHLVVNMEGQTTTLINRTSKLDFVFDYSFWSFDGFQNDQTGQPIRVSKKYADQNYVFNSLGQEIIKNTWSGYHSALIAYGQTGAGKSYTMFGQGTNSGVIPLFCESVFYRIKQNQDPYLAFDVRLGILEIYNEKVQDLLIPINKRPQGGLKVKEHKVFGVYVEGLTKYQINSLEEMEVKINEANKNRSIAATQMNITSSRAHTIIQIEIKQITISQQKPIEKSSVIHFVDLAGSENLDESNNDRFKESNCINKSLTVLGLVISGLANNLNNQDLKKVIPYKDSQLTKLLQGALGGNSKTFMICTISPSNCNYDETLRTLKYANQAKNIQNKAIVNENNQEKLIEEQKETIAQLRQQLNDLIKNQANNIINEELINQMQKSIDSEECLLNEQNNQIKQAKQVNEGFKIQQSDSNSKDIRKWPHLINLHEDYQYDRKVVLGLQKQFTYVGRPSGNPVPDIILNGLFIQKNHAIITNEDGTIHLEPADEDSSEFIHINGEQIKQKQQIFHNDRIIFGTTTFLLQFPEYQSQEQSLQQQAEFNWEYAQEEKNEKEQMKWNDQQKKEARQIEEYAKIEKEIYELKMMNQQQEYEKKLKQLEEMRQNEKKKKQIEDEETLKKYRIKEKKFIENKLSKYLPKVLEVNLIAKELKRNVQLEAKLKYVYAENNDVSNFNEENAQKGQIQIQVNNREEGLIYLWDLHKFSNRYYIIKDLLDKYFETNQLPTVIQQEDPFWDPPEPRIIGQGFLKIQALAYLMDNPSDLTLVGEHFQSGTLQVNLIPTDETGQRNISDDIEDGLEPAVEDPQELLNKRFDFRVVIGGGKLPDNLCKDTFVEYQLQIGENKEIKKYQTKILQGLHPQPQYNYDQQHTYKVLTEELYNYLYNGTICFKVFGFEDLKIGKSAKNRPIVEAIDVTKLQTTLQQEQKQQILPVVQESQPRQSMRVAEDFVSQDHSLRKRQDQQIIIDRIKQWKDKQQEKKINNAARLRSSSIDRTINVTSSKQPEKPKSSSIDRTVNLKSSKQPQNKKGEDSSIF